MCQFWHVKTAGNNLIWFAKCADFGMKVREGRAVVDVVGEGR